MGEEHDFRNILIDEMAIQLPCTTPGCDHGDGGTPYKTLALEPALAMEMLNNHRADAMEYVLPGAAGLVVGSKSTSPRSPGLSSVGEAAGRNSGSLNASGTNTSEPPMRQMRSGSETSYSNVQMQT